MEKKRLESIQNTYKEIMQDLAKGTGLLTIKIAWDNMVLRGVRRNGKKSETEK